MDTSVRNEAPKIGAAPISSNPWILAARPRTLPAAISPVLVGWGIAISMHQFSLLPALAAMFCSLWVQIGTNYFNDVIDYTKGTDTGERLGPTRVTQAKLLSPRQVYLGGAVSYFLAGLAGIYLASKVGLVVILIGLACFTAGILYTAGRYSLVNIGLAGLFVLIFFGFVAVMGTVYVITASVPLEAWLGGLACGALVTNILVINNIRDMHTDRPAGRRNIAAIFGRKAAEGEYLFYLIAAYLVPPALILWADSSWTVLLPYLSLPFAAKLFTELIRAPISREFNRLLAKTGMLVLFYSILLAIGFILSVWL